MQLDVLLLLILYFELCMPFCPKSPFLQHLFSITSICQILVAEKTLQQLQGDPEKKNTARQLEFAKQWYSPGLGSSFAESEQKNPIFQYFLKLQDNSLACVTDKLDSLYSFMSCVLRASLYIYKCTMVCNNVSKVTFYSILMKEAFKTFKGTRSYCQM